MCVYVCMCWSLSNVEECGRVTRRGVARLTFPFGKSVIGDCLRDKAGSNRQQPVNGTDTPKPCTLRPPLPSSLPLYPTSPTSIFPLFLFPNPPPPPPHLSPRHPLFRLSRSEKQKEWSEQGRLCAVHIFFFSMRSVWGFVEILFWMLWNALEGSEAFGTYLEVCRDLKCLNRWPEMRHSSRRDSL